MHFWGEIVTALCFGAYLAYVKEVMKSDPPTEEVVRLLFNAVIIPVDLRDKNDEPFDVSKENASKLLNGKINIPKQIKNNATSTKVTDSIYGYFKKFVFPQLMQGREADLLNNVLSCINHDSSIANDTKAVLNVNANMDNLAEFLADVFLYTLKIKNKDMVGAKSPFASQKEDAEIALETTGDVIDKVEALLNKLSRPPSVEPTSQIEEHELEYISALLLAYGDVIGIDCVDVSALEAYPAYKQDLTEQRIDYFAAYSVERGVLEFSGDGLTNQFNHLKDEIFTGVRYTAQKPFANGYEKLMEVLDKAVGVPTSLYVLSKSPYWISNKIKKGTCHFLVIDGKLVWVSK